MRPKSSAFFAVNLFLRQDFLLAEFGEPLDRRKMSSAALAVSAGGGDQTLSIARDCPVRFPAFTANGVGVADRTERDFVAKSVTYLRLWSE